MKTAAAYIRVSTDMQTELSPDSQLKTIKQYAENNGILLEERYIFSDDGISGRTAQKRPEFMRMIKTAKSKPKPFDVILVWKFSRFARSREDSILYKSMLRKIGIDVVSVSEPIGDDKTSVLIESLLEAMDEYYSLNLAEEVRRGMKEKISRGGIVVAPPIGYKVENGKYVPDENAALVRKIFDDFLSGKGTRKIAVELNDTGYTTERGNKFHGRSIEYILTNPTYIGKLRYTPTEKATTSHAYKATENTIIVDGKHEPIISEETFNAAQKRMKRYKEKYAKYYRERPQKSDYFFRGILKCSSCGESITQSVKGKAYQCCGYAHGTCTVSHYISADKIKNAVITALENDACSDTVLKFDNNIKKNKIATDLNDLIKSQIEKETAKLKRIKLAYEDGIDSLEEYKTAKTKIEAEIKALSEKLTNSKEQPEEFDITAFKKKISKTAETLSSPEITPEAFNSAFLDIAEKIIFDRKACKVEIFYKR